MNIMKNYEIDNLDLNILKFLQNDARIAFSEIAKKLDVSGGTIHQRIDKMRAAGVINKSKFIINHKILGHELTILIGIHLKNSRDIEGVIKYHPDISKIDTINLYYSLAICSDSLMANFTTV